MRLGKKALKAVKTLETWSIDVNHWVRFCLPTRGLSGPKEGQNWYIGGGPYKKGAPK